MTQQNLFGESPAQATNGEHARKPGGPPQHTWFFALRPSIEDSRRIHAFAGELLSFHGVLGKRIAPERLHITLELVGHDVDDALVEAACRVADAVSFPAMEARFEAAMTFSAPSGPLVLLGSEGLDEVRGLRTALGCAMADHGFAPPRAYEPHMTLCYDPRHRLAKTPITPIGFHAGDFALIKSHIGFSRHEVLRTWRLAG
ncbi:2'-5' RNA ligase family protein [Pinirhizobacter soli]|uniref:2'-5' RNA ligase family protein n=1 Tax=Pinirhizobacter soli TaxID=2786953 RepID=UPI00202A7F50